MPAKPCDQRWAVMNCEVWRSLPISFFYSSVSTLQGRFYITTPEGNILEATLRLEPRLVPVVVNQAKTVHNVYSYLVPHADDHSGGMLMVRYYINLDHLSVDERRIVKRRRKGRDQVGRQVEAAMVEPDPGVRGRRGREDTPPGGGHWPPPGRVRWRRGLLLPLCLEVSIGGRECGE